MNNVEREAIDRCFSQLAENIKYELLKSFLVLKQPRLFNQVCETIEHDSNRPTNVLRTAALLGHLKTIDGGTALLRQFLEENCLQYLINLLEQAEADLQLQLAQGNVAAAAVAAAVTGNIEGGARRKAAYRLLMDNASSDWFYDGGVSSLISRLKITEIIEGRDRDILNGLPTLEAKVEKLCDILKSRPADEVDVAFGEALDKTGLKIASQKFKAKLNGY